MEKKRKEGRTSKRIRNGKTDVRRSWEKKDEKEETK